MINPMMNLDCFVALAEDCDDLRGHTFLEALDDAPDPLPGVRLPFDRFAIHDPDEPGMWLAWIDDGDFELSGDFEWISARLFEDVVRERLVSACLSMDDRKHCLAEPVDLPRNSATTWTCLRMEWVRVSMLLNCAARELEGAQRDSMLQAIKAYVMTCGPAWARDGMIHHVEADEYGVTVYGPYRAKAD